MRRSTRERIKSKVGNNGFIKEKEKDDIKEFFNKKNQGISKLII